MSTFTFWKGFGDAAVGIILLTKPEIIYHSALARALNRLSGLRLPNPHPTVPGEISSQHAVAIMVIAIGVGHMRAAKNRSAIPAFVFMNCPWSALAFATVMFKPHRATSALLMTGINHLVFSGIMVWRLKMGFREILGLENLEGRKTKSA
ncbi:hypothetical protein BKA70DRAFT_1287453 [Coprinopsis sp. MPI-PUGE-AT-0042]|nr:hypothetical protein BKA70DRAFT_1287453 [Coprinopsis sp. MPI-PUGE-AT-0042]